MQAVPSSTTMSPLAFLERGQSSEEGLGLHLGVPLLSPYTKKKIKKKLQSKLMSTPIYFGKTLAVAFNGNFY